jgi:hypothetical protein
MMVQQEVSPIRVRVPAGRGHLQEEVRKLLARRHPCEKGAVRFQLDKGIHLLNDTLELNSSASGFHFEGAGAIISGGITIDGPWTQVPRYNGKSSVRLWKAALPAGFSASDYGATLQLWSGQKRMILARSPTHRYSESSHYTITFRGDDMRHYQNLADVFIVLYEAWTASAHRLKFVNEERHVAAWAHPWARFSMIQGWAKAAAAARYYVANAFEELDAVDEFYVDRQEGVVYIVTQAEADPNDNAEPFILAAGLRELVRIKGTAGTPVRNLSFSGLEFAHTAMEEKKIDTGRSDQGSSDLTTAAVHITFARDVSFTECTIRATGQYGFWTEQDTYRVSVVRSLFTDMGAGGIRVGRNALWRFAKVGHLDPPECEDHVFSDNVITDGGHVWQEGIGVFVQGAGNVSVSHNEISHLRYSGVSTGWTWGYGPTVVHDIKTTYNHIHHIGLGYLSDMACVYTLGHQPGSEVTNNYCHDVQSYGYGGWGYYTDEGSRDEHFENNIAYRTKCAGQYQHFGTDNYITNNLYVDVNIGDVPTPGRTGIVMKGGCDTAIGMGTHPRDRRTCPNPESTPWKSGCCCAPGCDSGKCSSLHFTKNVVYLPPWSTSSFLQSTRFYAGLWNSTFAGNLYYKASAPFGAKLFSGQSFGAWHAHKDWKSHWALDPKLGPNFTIADDSPARKMGFKPIDVSTVGPRSPWCGAPHRQRRPARLRLPADPSQRTAQRDQLWY